jgi:hypothetical protein
MSETDRPNDCPPEAGPDPVRERRSRRASPARRALHHVGQFCFGCSILVLVVTLGLVAVLAAGVEVPGWVRADLSHRINRDLPNHVLSFEGMGLTLGPDMAPRVELRTVSFDDTSGHRLADLTGLRIRLSRAALLRGEVRASAIRLDGGRLVLRRSESGALSIEVEGGGQPARGTVTEQIGALLAQPQLASLREVTAENLSLRYEDARAGRAWSADGGQASLTREGDQVTLRGNVTVLGAREYATSIELNYSAQVGASAAEFGIRFEDMPAGEIAGQSPALAWLAALDAPISGALRAAVDEAGQLGPLNATLQIGAGVLQPNPATSPIPFEAARSYFTYDPATQTIRFSELSVDSGWGRARADGSARLIGMEAGWPRELQAQISFPEIVADPPDLYPEPIALEGATMDMRLKLDPFVLSLGALRLNDQGRTLHLSGEARGQPDGWALALEGALDGIAAERLLALWPQSVKPKTRDWITENVREITLSDIQVALRAGAGALPDFFLGFDFDNLSTVYVRDVPPIEGAKGHASIRDNRFVMHAAQGHVTAAQGGRIDIAGTTFSIPDIRIKQSPAKAQLRTDSTITAALALLDSPPFRFLEKAGQPVSLADGRARLKGDLNFLMKDRLTPEEVAFEVTGALRDLRSETLVKGRVLTASALEVEASNRGIRIGGDARIGTVPLSGTWNMPLGPDTGGESRVRGQIELSERFAREFGIGLPPGTFTGAGRGEVEIGFGKDKPGQFALTSDLAGLGLRLPQVGWALSEAGTGRLDVTGTLGPRPEIEGLSLDAAGLRARGSVTTAEDGGFERATFSSVEIGDWLNAPVTLIGRGAGRAPRIELNGGTLDLRSETVFGGARNETGQEAASARGGPVVLRLDRLWISDTISLTDFNADLQTAGGMQGAFSGRVNGKTAITGDIVPQQGRSAFRIRSDDAGGVLGSANLLKSARKGRMELILTPAPEPGSYDGVLGIDEIRVKEAPALAALLNTISVVGLLEQLDGQGLHFSRIDARFRLSPTRLVLLEGSAVGASVGLSMDGFYDVVSKRMDMQGVISPVYVLNAIGEAFTRPGEGLIGFNYTITGSASAPAVNINPLSALTPGFLREMFRRPAPQVEGGGPPAMSRQSEPDTGRKKQPPYLGNDR